MIFDKYSIAAPHGNIPEALKTMEPLGYLAITKDTNHAGILHKIFYIFQRFHAWLTGRKNADIEMNHAMIFVNREGIEHHSNDFNSAHALIDEHKHLGDIKTVRTNYLTEYDVTEMIIYVPKDAKLRELLSSYGKQTSCAANDEEDKKLAKFSFIDIVGAFFKNKRKQTQPEKVAKAAKERLSYLTADLLKGTQFFEKDGVTPRNFICTAYAMSILQGSLLINALSEFEAAELKKIEDRTSLAMKILEYIETEKSDHSLSKTYYKNKICRLDAKYLMPSYATKYLDRVSTQITI